MGAGKIDLDEAVGFVVFQAHQAMRQAMFRVFRDEGVEVTPEQWVVMVRLWAGGGNFNAPSSSRRFGTLARYCPPLRREPLTR